MRNHLLLSAVFAAAALNTVPALAMSSDDAKAQALLSKHRTFVGWQFGDGTFRTMRITGNVSNGKGEKTSSLILVSVGLLYKSTFTELKRDNVTVYNGFTGNLFWETDYSGFTTPIYGDYAKFLASVSILRYEGTTELPASYIGPKSIDGKSTELVRVTLKNGDPIDLYIDPSTGAYVQATIDPDGAYETTFHILSYADVTPGKKMMSSYRVGEDTDIHAYTTFEPNIVVADQDLHPPAATAAWTFGNGQPFPFTMTHNRMLVDATLNGVKGRFILDTGADAIYIDDRFADRAGAEVLRGTGRAYTFSGEVKTRLRRIKSLTFGDATLCDALAFTQNFERNSYRGLDAKGYDGLIGFDLFAGTVVKLNVYDSTMAILDPATDLSSEKGLAITVDLSQGIPTIPMTLNKTIAVNAMLDTGNPGILFFGPDLVAKRHFKTFGRCVNIDSLAIGPIVYTAESACQYGMVSDYMLVGFDFLKHFNFVFDYPHGRLFMQPNKN